MYQKLPNLVLGFHGCHNDIFQKVIFKGEELKESNNVYDWLGNGIYFWENNYQRAYDWAQSRYDKNAAVVGAVIDLGRCLNLTDSSSAEILRQGYEILKLRCEATGDELPKNRESKNTKDILLRDLDCAVIQQIHDYYHSMNKIGFDSVRGVFTEGGTPYPGSAFCEKTHIQLCICNPNCIKGYFSVRTGNDNYPIP